MVHAHTLHTEALIGGPGPRHVPFDDRDGAVADLDPLEASTTAPNPMVVALVRSRALAYLVAPRKVFGEPVVLVYPVT